MSSQLCQKNLNSEMFNELAEKINTDGIDMLNVMLPITLENGTLNIDDALQAKIIHLMILLSNWLDYSKSHCQYLINQIENGYKVDTETMKVECENVINEVEALINHRHSNEYYTSLLKELEKQKKAKEKAS